MRIGIDGERGFSFGVDENWQPHAVPDRKQIEQARSSADKSSMKGGSGIRVGGGVAPSTLKEPEKRLDFYEKQASRRDDHDPLGIAASLRGPCVGPAWTMPGPCLDPACAPRLTFPTDVRVGAGLGAAAAAPRRRWHAEARPEPGGRRGCQR